MSGPSRLTLSWLSKWFFISCSLIYRPHFSNRHRITIGGANTPICHGAGLRHKTISDYVREIQYVDANGNVQVVSNTEWLKAAAGSFGLLGIITHITFEFDKMTYAVMTPKKTPVNLAVPPPPGYYETDLIPEPLRESHTLEQLEAARQDFSERATNDYFSEWFWFPFQKEVFVNCWYVLLA